MDLKPYIKLGLWTYNCSIGIAFVLMVAIGLRGLGEIGKGILYSIFRWPADQGGGSIPAVEGGIGSILEGFEFLLLAPLAFVIVVSVGNYLQALLQQAVPQTAGGAPPDGDRAPVQQPDRADQTEHQLHRVKGLIISLMISIVATDLVKRFVGHPEVKFDSLIFGGALIVLFTLYFVLLVAIRRIGR